MSRRVWALGLLVYVAAAAADMAFHLGEDARAGQNWRAPGNIAVAFSAGLFWPADLLAQRLLAG